MTYDAVLIVSFGGPEGPDDVMPFLSKVAGGRVPEARLRAVAEHYAHFGGVSPINARTAELVDAVRALLQREGPALPVYWGNRFWRPHLADAITAMRDDGVERAVAFCTAAFSSPPGCRRYLEDIASARAQVEGAPIVDKIRPYATRPGYIDTCVARLREALARVDDGASPSVFFSAHSIPNAMAATCGYQAELTAVAEAVARGAGVERWRVVYQSRSGRPSTPWLAPDVCDALDDLEPGDTVVVTPFGFVADHMEVVWDLDEEARQKAEAGGLRFVRAAAANTHPRFVRLVRELVVERLERGPDPCLATCCS